MGEWKASQRAYEARMILDHYGVEFIRASLILQTLVANNLLPADNYYVPDIAELYDQQYLLRQSMRHGKKELRWVMCEETYRDLARIHCDTRFAVAAEPLAYYPDTSESWQKHDPWASSMVVTMPGNGAPARLFDMPIRIDPAARRPMFEFVEEERNGSTEDAH